MGLQLQTSIIPDPDGHNPKLLLKGDWVVAELSDGEHSGQGEASHSKDDDSCAMTMAQLHSQYIADFKISPQSIKRLESGPFNGPANFVEATAMSALNQALYNLAAAKEEKPLWKLFALNPLRTSVPCYATINRSLTSRDASDYIAVTKKAIAQGFHAIKCAPFDAVSQGGDPLKKAEEGLEILRQLREAFPELSIRIDFHKRFTIDAFRMLLPQIRSFKPEWIEEPIPLGPEYERLRKMTNMKIAAGELRYGWSQFKDVVESECVDVIMPDVKHVGGIGPLLTVSHRAEGMVEVSPHSPSGPVSALATLHCAAVAKNITSMELPLIIDNERAYYLDWLKDGELQIPGV